MTLFVDVRLWYPTREYDRRRVDFFFFFSGRTRNLWHGSWYSIKSEEPLVFLNYCVTFVVTEYLFTLDFLYSTRVSCLECLFKMIGTPLTLRFNREVGTRMNPSYIQNTFVQNSHVFKIWNSLAVLSGHSVSSFIGSSFPKEGRYLYK